MNLESRIDPRLWTAVRSNLETRHFTDAVLDAIRFLSDLIRERTDLETDGVVLINAAFGGKAPKLRNQGTGVSDCLGFQVDGRGFFQGC